MQLTLFCELDSYVLRGTSYSGKLLRRCGKRKLPHYLHPDEIGQYEISKQ
jgi:hypothetical protein